jgi:hypothetical protein
MDEAQRIAVVEGGGFVSDVGLVYATATIEKVEAWNSKHKDEARKGYEIRETRNETQMIIIPISWICCGRDAMRWGIRRQRRPDEFWECDWSCPPQLSAVPTWHP